MIEIVATWLLPPLAFGRFGSGGRPCQAFAWSDPSISPDAPSRTVLVPADTIEVGENGTPRLVSARSFDAVSIKDEDGRFYPVCPFFELHARWRDGEAEEEAPVTVALLEGAGLSLSDVTWSVSVGNLKPYQYTLRDSDRIEARVDVVADDTAPHTLEGLSPGDDDDRLVPGPEAVRLGSVQAIRPSDELPGLRLRVTPPKGIVYAPTDLAERVAGDQRWDEFRVPDERAILNPRSAWAQAVIGGEGAPGPLPADRRVNPEGLVATVGRMRSIGLVDDVCDGLVRCTVGTMPPASARIVIGPPDFAPAARPFVSLQDGLADRIDRSRARAPDLMLDELEAVVGDIFERALETSELVNKDAQAGRARLTNGEPPLPPPSPDFETPPVGTMWPSASADSNLATRVDAMPITSVGSRKHRRLNTLAYVKGRLRDDPAFVERWLRPPLDQSGEYDRRMPPSMRGSDRRPMHLTRRQYELVVRWSKMIVAAGG